MTETSSSEAREAYYREAGSWTADRIAAARKAQRNAWIIAGCACAVALCEAIALIALTPLKTVEPYTLLVDRQTGHVQALAPLDAQKIAPDNALTQSFLVQYVIARESFNIATVQGDYRKTALWSDEAAKRDYVSRMQPSNPASPLVEYPRTTTVETFIRSVSPLGGNKAMVRFTTQRRDAGATPRLLGNWVAVVSYRYSSAPLSLQDRFINPLGFQVVSYRKEQESLPEAVAPQPDPREQATAQAPDDIGPTVERKYGEAGPLAQDPALGPLYEARP